MKSKHLLLTLLLALFVPWAANAQTLTVHDESGTNNHVPFYGLYADEDQTNQMIYPATELADMNGKAITEMVFYWQEGYDYGYYYGVGTWTVSLGETTATTLSGLDNTTSLTPVFTGVLDEAGGLFDNTAYTLTIAFDDQYVYGGGNLLVQFSHTETGEYEDYVFEGESVTGASYCYDSQCNFLPKTTFTYEMPAAFPSPKNLQISDITAETATASWEAPTSATPTGYQYQYKFAETPSWPDTWNSINDTHKDLVNLFALKTYDFRVRANYAGGDSEPIEKQFTTTAQVTAVGDSWSDDFEGTECGWELINGILTNKWCWGTAVNNGGTHSLYVSKDNGTSNTYTGSGTKIFAAKLLNFTEGKFNFSFDWKCKGENNYDFIRVALVPASQTLTAGSDYSTIGYSSLPTGWIAVDGGSQLNQSSATTPTWQNKEAAVNVSAGNYYLVLVWRNDSDVYDPAAAVDNVSITRVACPYDVTGLTVATSPAVTENTATVTWTAGEATQWQVAYSANSNFEGAIEEIVSTPSYNMIGLTANTKYYVKVRAYCGGEDYGTWCNAISFYTECPQYTTIPAEGWTINFDDMTGVTSGTTNNLPHCWNYINTSTNSTYKGYPVVYNYQSSSHSGNNHLRFLSYYYSSSSNPADQYAILPAMENVNTLRVKFYARANSTGSSTAVYDATFKVGVMEGTDASTFTEIASYTPESTTYQLYTVPLSSYTGTGTRIAFMIEAAQSGGASYTSYYRSVFIDDITVEEIPNCLEPSDFECTATSTTTATLHWTAGGTETAWDIYVSTNNTAPTNSTTPTVSATANNPATVPGLTASTKYYAWVRAHCSDSDQSPWIGGISFITDCEARTIDADHHYTENFNDYTAGSTGSGVPSTYPNDELPLCWQFLNRSENSSTYPMVFLSSNTSYAVSGNCLFFKSSSTTPLYAILPEFTNDISDLMLTFTYRNEGTSTSNGTLYVSYMTDPTDASTFNTEHAVAYDRTTTLTEKEVFFENAPAGSYIAFKYQGGSSNNYYLSIDDVKVELAPSCRKPSDLTKDATTAHTATLHWTNGSTDQDAWQIAYSTNSSFAPADNFTPGENEWLVDVTTNPATIEGLSQSTTYYAYVRAYCGGTDYSAWCNAKVTFSTVAGNVTPTGLTVEASTVTSSQATASWNAVAGNTLHEYYQIYWAEATVTSVPDEPAAPNLITNITATSQIISGLDPETEYKVWVRDICGDDGNSAWSTTPVTFTTAAECQLPDGLDKSNVTTNSATITWNTYGQTSFNLQYSSDGGTTWTTVPSVNSPYTFPNNLTANTAYQVQVQAACNTEAWSTVLSFRTECDAMTITDSYSYTEDFEDPVTTSTYNSMTGLEVPYCWDNYTTNTSYAYARPHIIKESASYNYATSGQVLYFYGSGYGYAELPEFTNAINTLQISFKWATESDSNGSLTLGYITNEDNGTYNTFTAIGESFAACSESYHTLKSETVYLNNVPATATRLVFRWYYSSWYGANIDDIEVSLLPSCYPVGTLSAATDVTYNSAKLSWALNDNTQDEWTVQYATNAAFTEGVDTKTATTNTNYELTGLTPETHYWVRVKAACSTTDDWSNAIDFETEVFCAVSVPTAANITQTTADLSWTGESDSYNIQYRTASVPTATTILTEDFESYADEAALEAVWTVIDLGDGANTSELGLYTVSGNKVFRFSSYNGSSSGSFDQYLISPELTSTGLLEFAYKSSSGNSDKFRVGYSSTTNDVSAFTWGAETNSASSWKTYSETMPEDAKYFAINYTAVYQYRLYIDDITIYEIQPAGTWQNATSETASKQLTGLAAGTKYDVQVQGVCDGTAGNWSESINFTTLPFTKTINAYDTQNEKGWYLIASPLAEEVNLDDVDGLTDNDFRLYRFNQNAELEWEYYNGSNNPFTSLVNGTGYLYANSEDVTLTFVGAPLAEDTYNVTLQNNADAPSLGGWNLVGNPFGATAYITGEFSFYTLDNGSEVVPNNSFTSIEPMEAVFVYTEEDGGILTFTTSEPNSAPGKGGNLALNVSHNRGNVIDRAIVNFGEGGTLPKFQLNPNHTKVYIPQDNKDYAIVTADNQGSMPVNFKAEHNGAYTLSFSSEEVSFNYLHLIDNLTGAEVDLLQTPSYTFNATTTDYESRFKLVFCTGVNDDSDSFAFCSNGNWIINNDGEAILQVIDVTGRILSSETVNGSVSKAIHAAPGVYMLRLINGDNVKVQKIVVR